VNSPQRHQTAKGRPWEKTPTTSSDLIGFSNRACVHPPRDASVHFRAFQAKLVHAYFARNFQAKLAYALFEELWLQNRLSPIWSCERYATGHFSSECGQIRTREIITTSPSIMVDAGGGAVHQVIGAAPSQPQVYRQHAAVPVSTFLPGLGPRTATRKEDKMQRRLPSEWPDESPTCYWSTHQWKPVIEAKLAFPTGACHPATPPHPQFRADIGISTRFTITFVT